MFATVIHPQIEVKTAEARNILPKNIPLKDAITQWSNVGSLVHALHTSDYNLLGESLQDVIVEPYRSQLIPHFNTIKTESLKAGALGVGISGSGPSIFALSKGKENAEVVAKTMKNVYSKTNINFNVYVSKINTQGMNIL